MPQELPRPVVGQRPLVSLRDYSAPSMPTEHAIRRYWRLLRLHFQPDSADPVRAGARLQPATRKLLDSIAAPPACGPLIEELQLTVDAWHAEAPPGSAWMRAVVMAPCDHGDLVGSWAQRHGHQVLRPPPRGTLLETTAQIDWQALAGEGLLVVPQLERWFLRERNGLATVRGLIEALSQLERPCIVGCNSWAWAFLEKAAGASLVMPSAVTFQAFRAKQLNAWFASLAKRDAQAGAVLWYGALGAHAAPSAQADDASALPATPANPAKRQADALASAAAEVESEGGPGQPLVFRLTSTGADVLREPSAHHDPDDSRSKSSTKHEDGYLQRLAARSLGIPWVAWNLWRDGLCAAHDTEQVPDKVKHKVQDDGHTLWVSDLPEFSLPSGYERPALMVAHALLLHGGLTRAQLQGVLPAQAQPGILAALQDAGYVEWCEVAALNAGEQRGVSVHDPRVMRAGSEAEVRVRACAYPALRSALKTAGFPVGVI